MAYLFPAVHMGMRFRMHFAVLILKMPAHPIFRENVLAKCFGNIALEFIQRIF